MTILALGRRRGGSHAAKTWPASGFACTLPSSDLERHGGGYPITYVFAVPDVPGLHAQWWHSGAGGWLDFAPPTTGRYDGEDVARIAGTSAWLSKAHRVSEPTLYLRIIDPGGTEVGTFTGIAQNYDGREVGVIITYDDSTSVMPTAAAVHAQHKIWGSNGINSGRIESSGLGYTAFADAVATGYIEPVSHGRNHVAASAYVDQAQADFEIVTGSQEILAACTMPRQNRGRVLAHIYANGPHNALAYEAMRRAGHLVGRTVINSVASIESGDYTADPWDSDLDLVPAQLPSLSPALYNQTDNNPARISRTLAAIERARTLGGHCMIYTYMYVWNWGASDPWPQMLATLSTDQTVWSVALGHWALYNRMRERVTVTAI